MCVKCAAGLCVAFEGVHIVNVSYKLEENVVVE